MMTVWGMSNGQSFNLKHNDYLKKKYKIDTHSSMAEDM